MTSPKLSNYEMFKFLQEEFNINDQLYPSLDYRGPYLVTVSQID